jgi:hypothetical protein
LLQLSIADITVTPLGKFDDLFGHVDENHDKRRDDDKKYNDRHQKRDRIVPFRERSPKFCVKGVERKRENGRPENSCEERRKNVKDFVNNKNQGCNEEKGDELFAFHGFSPNSFQFQRI